MTDPIVLLLFAAAFAFANGLNDGGALVATSMSVPSVPIWAAFVMLVLAVLVVPATVTVAVATTLGQDLVNFGEVVGHLALLAAIAASLAVVWLLTSRGLPTSLTLSLVGGLAGAGLGSGLPVSWSVLLKVLLLAAAAPLLAAVLAMLIWAIARSMPESGSLQRALARTHRVAFATQCLAYGLNDGQKMIAVVAIAFGLDVVTAARSPAPIALIGVAFALGTAFGIRRVARTVGAQLLPIRPLRAVVTETSAAATVIGTGLIGAPVSMTQSIVGGLVGTGVSAGSRRVRWATISRLGLAWGLTLPLAFLAGATLGFVGTVVR